MLPRWLASGDRMPAWVAHRWPRTTLRNRRRLRRVPAPTRQGGSMPTRAIAAVVALLLLPLAAPAELSTQLQQQLATGKYVYISSTRKDGSLSTPSEIWYMWRDGAVYVATRPASWRVRRIKAGRTQAKIAVGSIEAGSFMATGSLIKDPAIEELIMKTYA